MKKLSLSSCEFIRNMLKNKMLRINSQLLLLVFFSCVKSETETLPEIGKTYYPLSIGKTLTYDLDSIIYDPILSGGTKIDTTRWQIKDVFKDTFRDNSGILQYRIERSERIKGNLDWKTVKAVTAAFTDNQAIGQEDNLRFIKFPLVFNESTTWNAMIFNDSAKVLIAGETLNLFSKKWSSKIVSFGKKEAIGTKTFDDVLTVLSQISTTILTEKRYLIEKYAKNTGLVYREYHVLDTQKLDATVAWEKKAEKGAIIIQRFLE
jgi:hypothetical protein